MATLNTAVQAMVDNLHAKMSGDTPLTAEEQTLVAAAIEKLGSNISWEQALVAVAEQHLNSATSAMTSSLNTAASALTQAENSINAANSTLQSQNSNLSLIPQVSTDVQTKLDTFTQSNTSMLAGMSKPVFGLVDIESKTNANTGYRSNAIFAVYDADGKSYLARPGYTAGATSEQHNLLEYLSLAKDGSSKNVIATHYVHDSMVYTTPGSYIYAYGSTAVLPLAAKDNSADIVYDVVYSLQHTADTSASSYAGVFCRSAGYSSVTLPKLNIEATDQFGLPSSNTHNWGLVRVLYDNIKHCLVVVDSSTSLLVEKYRDGNITTDILIADSTALQDHVNNGDFTVIALIANYLAWPSCYKKSSNSETNISVSLSQDVYGFYGILSGHVRMGHTQYSAHYRFTAEKKLEPLNFVFNSSTNHITTGTASFGLAQLAVTDIQGNTLGVYRYETSSDSINQYSGYMGNAIMCMNPYSHVGMINEVVNYSNNTACYGIGRTCKAY